MAIITVTNYDHLVAAQVNPLCFDGTVLWMAHDFIGTLTIITEDPATGDIVNTFAVATAVPQNYRPPCCVFAGSIWFGGGRVTIGGSPAQNLLTKVSSAGALQGNFNLTGLADIKSDAQTEGIATDGTSLFLAASYTDTLNNTATALTAYDAASTILWSVKLPNTRVSGPVSDGAGGIWIATWGDGTVDQYDAATGALMQSVTLGGGAQPVSLAFANGDIWPLDGNNGSIFQVNAVTGAVIGSTPLGPGASSFPYYVQADPSNNLWVIAQLNSGTFDYQIIVFDSSRALVATYTWVGSNASPNFDIQNSLAFAQGRMFGTGVAQISGSPTLFAFVLAAGSLSAQFFGTHVGILNAGFFGGGTK